MWTKDKEKEQFENRLKEKAPKLLRLLNAPLEKNIPYYPIQLSVDVGPGWWPIIEQTCGDIEKLGTDIEVVQIKEKFGELRFYTNFCNDGVDALITEAEKKTSVTCEKCGKVGELRTERSWLLTLCDDCDKINRPFG